MLPGYNFKAKGKTKWRRLLWPFWPLWWLWWWPLAAAEGSPPQRPLPVLPALRPPRPPAVRRHNSTCAVIKAGLHGGPAFIIPGKNNRKTHPVSTCLCAEAISPIILPAKNRKPSLQRHFFVIYYVSKMWGRWWLTKDNSIVAYWMSVFQCALLFFKGP